VIKKIQSTGSSIPAKKDSLDSALAGSFAAKEGVPETVIPKIGQETSPK
jgi:hypothetical protein